MSGHRNSVVVLEERGDQIAFPAGLTLDASQLSNLCVFAQRLVELLVEGADREVAAQHVYVEVDKDWAKNLGQVLSVVWNAGGDSVAEVFEYLDVVFICIRVVRIRE